MTLEATDIDTAAYGRNDPDDLDPLTLRVIMNNMINPTTDGDNPINIYHYKDGDSDGDPVLSLTLIRRLLTWK